MKYILLIHSPEESWAREDWEACVVKSTEICNDLAARGEFLDASPLHSVTTAKTVRVRNGQSIVTSGPYAETAEQLGGYFLLDVDEESRAIEVASQLPAAERGYIEVRKLFQLDGLPDASQVSQAQETSDGQKKSRYLLLCYDDEQGWREAGEGVLRAAMQEAVGNAHDWHAEGAYINASPLSSSESRRMVRVRNGKTMVTDGPFAESREVLGGFFVLSTATQDRAVEMAAKHPGARNGAVEVRQLIDVDGLPDVA